MDGSKPGTDRWSGRESDLFTEMRERLADPDWSSWSEDEFAHRAGVAFRHQFETCDPYRAFCQGRGVTPDTLATWTDIPAVPATAFKYFEFVSRPGHGGGIVFRTSGTTRGGDARGRHHVPDPELYRASLAEPFRRALLPEAEPTEEAKAVFLSLIPSPTDAPDSSLSFMVGAAGHRFARDVLWLVEADGSASGQEWARVAQTLDEAKSRGGPVLLLGTALAFVHLMEGARGVADLGALPEWTRVMETGGFKGARREVSRDALYQGIEGATGVDRHRIVNEYGMTELLSQLYASGAAAAVSGAGVAVSGAVDEGVGLHRPPPWLKVRAVDPVDLRPLPDGRDGILAFFDLANLGSVCHVLTEDVGSIHEGRVRLRGRALGSEPRGCSRAMDELMMANRG